MGIESTATKHLLTEEVVLVVSSRHPLARLPTVPLKMLQKEIFLFPGPQMNMSSVFADACRQAGFEPTVGYRANYPELLKNLVRAGLGLLPLPKMLTSSGSLRGISRRSFPGTSAPGRRPYPSLGPPVAHGSASTDRSYRGADVSDHGKIH